MSLNRRLADMTGSVEYRTARLFATLASRLGQARDEGVFVPLPLSRREIADLVGTTVETAIRVMSRWHKEKLVETEAKGFRIHALEALHAIAPEE
jgi:CRP/FNR family transcriptional regulator